MKKHILSARRIRKLLKTNPIITEVSKESIRVAQFAAEEYVRRLSIQATSARRKKKWRKTLMYKDLEGVLEKSTLDRYAALYSHNVEVSLDPIAYIPDIPQRKKRLNPFLASQVNSIFGR